MKKEKQIKENIEIEEFINRYNKVVTNAKEVINYKRLFYCKAWFFTVDNFIVLQSYSTIVAVIDTKQKTLYDFLRYVYGYTSTSAQHIAKFRDLFRASYDKIITYRPV